MSEFTMSAAQFKAQCLELMDRVASHSTEIVITKRGRPVARLVPYYHDPPPLFGFMAGSGTVTGDIVASLDETWNAEHE